MFNVWGRACLVLLSLCLVSCQEQEHEDDEPVVVTAVPGGGEFALDLYRQIAAEHEGESLFFSPFSVRSALAMTWEGARGETADQMAAALKLPELAGSDIHAGLGSMTRSLNAKGKPYEFSVANAVWVDRTLLLADSYVQQIKDAYRVGIEQADFIRQPESERVRINQWVEQQTRDRITDLMSSGTVTEDTRLVLANAIYFKGQWAEKFDGNLTRDSGFQLANGTHVLVPTMKRTNEKLAVSHGEGFRLLELPYVGNTLSMVILLPHRADGLTKLEESLTVEVLDTVLNELHEREINMFQMPKFKVSPGESYRLNSALQAMGMVRAFVPGADFTGLSPSGGNLFISDVMHQGFVEVNEEGTEAAAATGVGVMATSASMVNVDRPFLFLIRHRPTGEILFMGRVLDPRGE